MAARWLMLVVFFGCPRGGIDEPCNRNGTCQQGLKCERGDIFVDHAHRCVPAKEAL